MAGYTALCHACSGKAKCAAVKLSPSSWRRVPWAVGLHWLCPLRAQSGPCPSEVAEGLQQPGCGSLLEALLAKAPCTVRAFIARSQPRCEGTQQRAGGWSRVLSELCPVFCAAPGAAQCAGSPGCSVLQGRGAQPRCSDARERNCKASCRLCCSKVRAVAVLHWCCRALLGAGSPVAATAASLAHLPTCAHTQPGTEHGLMSHTWHPALLWTGLPAALLSPGIS